jgi:CelD/BcsL family acetyltransferase involved in cellulose biosynthesis
MQRWFGSDDTKCSQEKRDVAKGCVKASHRACTQDEMTSAGLIVSPKETLCARSLSKAVSLVLLWKEGFLMKTDQSYDEFARRSPLRIIELDPESDPRWEALMNCLPTSSIYQHPVWLGVLEEAYGYKPLHLACEDATGTLRGVLPLFSRWGLRTGRLCFSTPPESCPLTDDEQIQDMLIQAAISRSRKEQATTFEFITRSTSFNRRIDGVVGVPDEETYELALPEQPDRLHLDSKIRRAVKKATRSGVQIRPAETMGNLRAWYALYLQTTRRLVILPQPYRVFELAWQRLQPQGLLQLLLAEQVEAGHRRLLAGFLYLQWKQTITYLMAGWRWEDQALRPNDLLHWHAIHQACEQGLRCYDFGGVNTGNQGLAQYKIKWGAEPRMLYSYSYPLVARGGTSATMSVPDQSSTSTSASSPSDPSRSIKRRLMTPLWQRLPLGAIELAARWRRALHYY